LSKNFFGKKCVYASTRMDVSPFWQQGF
jgi:hypothetical protein